jgi:chromosome segregation ATPase
VFQNRLPPATFSSKKINKIIGDNVENRNYDVDEIDEFIRELKRREKAVQAMEAELEREREKAEEEVKRMNEKVRRLREEIDREEQVKPQKRILKVGKVYHRQELKKVCKCAEGIELECRHLACKDCMVNWYTDVYWNNKGKSPSKKYGLLSP